MRTLLFLFLALVGYYALVVMFTASTASLNPPPPKAILDIRDLGEGEVPPPSRFDPRIQVNLNPPGNSSGTAFAIAPKIWMTAAHVVNGCDRIYILNNGRWDSSRIKAQAKSSTNTDLAILTTQMAKPGFSLAKVQDLHRGQSAFIVGYPKGNTGQVRATLIGRGHARFAARRHSPEPVLVWAETGRSKGLVGSIGGISGGPVFDALGRIIGVATAESARRGRVFTAAPRSLHSVVRKWRIDTAKAKPAGVFAAPSFDRTSNALRKNGRVVKVVCLVNKPRRPNSSRR